MTNNPYETGQNGGIREYKYYCYSKVSEVYRNK